MARLLLAGLVDERDSPKEAAAAVQRVWSRIAESLRRSVGDDGYNALVARALHRIQAQHPAVLDIRRVVGDTTYLDSVEVAAEKHGAPAVTAAIEAVLTEIIDILSSLVGTDMVGSLLQRDGTFPHGPGIRPI
jgi:hypothetical protein